MKAKMLLFDLAGGVLITLLTGLLPNMSGQLVGAVHYGHPFPWLTRLIVAPQYYPWQIMTFALIVDILNWTVIVGIVLFVVEFARKRTRR